MKKSIISASFAVLALTFVGCSSESTSEDAVTPMPTVAPIESSTPSPSQNDSTTNSRGNLEKSVGDEAGVMTAEGEAIYTFKVNSITPDIQCTQEYATAPENGHFVAVDMDVVTSNAQMMEENYMSDVFITPSSWSFISAEGTVFNGDLGTVASFSCLGDETTLAMSIGPDQKANGIVLLDVPNLEGTLVYEEPGMFGGFEYKIQ